MAHKYSPLAAKIPQNATIVRLAVGAGANVLTAEAGRRSELQRLSALASLR